jgi:thiol:disulfide interchange protein DsbA
VFETTAKSWKSNLGSDVAFIYSPVALNSVEETMSKAFYTAQVLGVFDKVHQPFFDTFHIERKMISSVDQVEEFFTKAGVDKERFRKTFNSFGVTSAAKQAKTRDESAKISSTPSLVINGKYLIQVQSNSGGGNAQERLLKVADYIIEEIRNKRM